MIMKKTICLILALVAAGFVWAQSSESSTWKVTLKVVDEDSQPVTNAQVWVAYGIPPSAQQSNDWGKVEGVTDSNGTFTASHGDTGSYSLGIHVRKVGYYQTDLVHDLGPSYKPDVWNPNLTFMLSKIISPIPMYAKYVENGPPVFNEPVGYDLMIGDWVAPHGKGQTADIIFTGQLDKKSKNDFDYKLTVSFPKSGDGIQEFTVPPTRFAGQGSGLRSPHEAPADGYQSQVIRTMSRHPGQQPIDDHDGNRNYFFRVRTVLDANGNLKSALYGKIYGDFMQFKYYLNPIPNSRNIEFDPKQNLLGGLKSFERVTAP
jgi:hypothetical protein